MFELIPLAGFGPLARRGRLWDGLFEGFLAGAPGPAWLTEEGFEPKVDVKDNGKAYEISAELPGLKPEDLEVTLKGDVLTIKGQKRQEREDQGQEYHLVERKFGSFARGFRLPAEVDRGGLKASHKDGVLHITLPKVTATEPARVEVKVQ